MATVRLLNPHRGFPHLRQTPAGDGVWGDHVFTEHDVDSDWLVTAGDVTPDLETRVPRSRRILFFPEPPEVHAFPPGYAGQFGWHVTPFAQKSSAPARVLYQHSALPWHYGIDMQARPPRINLDWAALRRPVDKTATLSVIASDKRKTAQQRVRLDFVERLKERLGERVSHFGRGFTDMRDKAEAIAPFRYHIVLENNLIPHFWTEKLADAYLGLSFPIVAGGGALEAYFPEGSFVQIDLGNPDGAIAQIEALLARDPYDEVLPLLEEARRRVMEEHNLFAAVARIIAQSQDAPAKLDAPERMLRIRDFAPWLRLRRRLGL